MSVNKPSFIYGTAWKEERTQALVELAIANGFRAIDTANQRKHYFEQAVGHGISAAIDQELVERANLFLQSKYTFQRGQDHRLPYDPKGPIEEQVWQSFESSLRHLNTDYLDSLVLHGPSSGGPLTDADWAAWRGLEQIQKSGRARVIGVSNVTASQLKALCKTAEISPTYVQNRCYAAKQWDREVRQVCVENGISYQGFSLLTANRAYLKHPAILEIGKRHGMSISQTLFRFAIDVGMIPLTGTSKGEHMTHDLLVKDFKLGPGDVATIEKLAVPA